MPRCDRVAVHRRVVDRPLSATASCWPPAHRKDDRERSKAHPGAHPSAICRRYLTTGHSRDPEHHRRRGASSRSGKAPADVHCNVPLGVVAGHHRGEPDRRTRAVRPVEPARSGADRRRNRIGLEVVESDSLSLETADILKLELLLGARCGEIAGYASRRSIAKNGFGRCPLTLEKWASACHANRGPRARDTRTTAICRRDGTSLRAGQRRGR